MIGQASTTILLLISCSNIAGLMLARGLARRKEMAIRTAVGASRALLIRQILIESILTSSIAGILSLFFVSWILHAGRRLIPYDLLVTIDPNQIVLGKVDILFGFLISVVSAFLFGILPALQMSKFNLNEMLKEGSQQDSSRFRIIKSREAVTCIQVAFALVLLISGGLVFRSISNVFSVNPGFRTDDIWTTEIILPDFRYHDDDRIIQFERALLHKARDVFGVHHAAITSNLPLQGIFQSVTAEIEGQRIADVSYRLTSKDYPSTFDIPLLKGHYFSDSEKEPVAIINESLAKRFFKEQDVVGRFIKCGQMSSRSSISRRIIGIIRDTKSQGLDVPSEPEIYVPFYQDPSSAITLIVRSKLGKSTLTQKMQNVISGIDKTQPFQDVISMRQVLSDSENQRKFITSILSISAIIAFVLSLVGIYGTISYYTQQRQQEIAIRRAIGATEHAIKRIVLAKAARIVIVGVLLGLAVALPSTRLLANWLFHVDAVDAWTFISSCGLLVITALLAASFPARRAARLDPMKALRYE